jgi:hypothetical protein
MNSSENSGSSCVVAIMAPLVMRVMRHSPIAVAVVIRSGWPLRHPSPKEPTCQSCDRDQRRQDCAAPEGLDLDASAKRGRRMAGRRLAESG